GIFSYGNRGEMPHSGNQCRNVVGSILLVFFLRRGEKKSQSVGISKDRGGERDFHGRSFSSLLRQGSSNAELAAFAELRDGTEQALRRFRRAQRGAQLHHGLVPVAGRFW